MPGTLAALASIISLPGDAVGLRANKVGCLSSLFWRSALTFASFSLRTWAGMAGLSGPGLTGELAGLGLEILLISSLVGGG